jgi:hypothetical protein
MSGATGDIAFDAAEAIVGPVKDSETILQSVEEAVGANNLA